MQIIALSSSRVGNGGYLEAALPIISDFLGDNSFRVAFVPFAAVDGDYDDYATKVQESLQSLPYTIRIVTPEKGKEVIEESDLIMVGGGNTFKLLHDLYHYDLFSLLQRKVQHGTPYIGWSAGANLTGQTICTTNDMPIIQPATFTSFNFFPFQINPHYHNSVTEGFNGETRDQRLMEFMLLHPGVPVIGLPEGTALVLTENTLRLAGSLPAVLFTTDNELVTPQKRELLPGTDLSFLR